jgi:membrane protein YqaA with SNARE-associated domain
MSNPPPTAEPPEQRASSAPARAIARVLGTLNRWAESGWSGAAAAVWAMLQSSVIPGPSNAVLIPLGLADPRKALSLAFWTIIGSTVGALLGYWIGATAYDSIGLPLLGWLGVSHEQLASMEAMFASRGMLVVALASLPLLPSKVAAIIAGMFGMPVGQFLLITFIVRGSRFLVEGLLLRFAGDWMRKRLGAAVLTLPSPAARAPRAHR